MVWFFKSKSASGQVPAEPKPKRVTFKSLQEDVIRLQAENAEAIRLQAQWQTSAEESTRDRDAMRTEMVETIAAERQQYADKISQLKLSNNVLESDLKVDRQKLALLDETNIKFAEMVRERDATIEEALKSRDRDLQVRDSQIQQRDDRIREVEAQLAESSTTAAAHIEELTQQLSTLREQSSATRQNLERQLASMDEQSKATVLDLERRLSQSETRSAELAERLRELETQHRAAIEEFGFKAAELERKLAESEARSSNRAEQRSALLRNMIEIHRLSAVSGKSAVSGPSDASSEALKILDPSWPEEVNQSASESA